MKKIILIAVVIFSVRQNSFAQQKQEITLLHGAHRIGKRTDSLMQRWRDYGLGEFIHFGLYSMLGGDWKGEHYNGASEWIYSWDKVNKAEYDSLYKQFNPVNLNPAQWAAMAKQMGARYVTITTKHHDGFCLWQSKYTHFTVAGSLYKKDIIGPLVDAYNKQGIDVYLYFSIMDWSNPDWRYDLKNADDSAAFNRFKTFTKNQLTELLTLYPAIKGLWFDGTWDKSWQKSGAFTDSLEQYLKQLHPGLIIGSRLRADDFGNRHFDANGHLMGDYEQGWERKYPVTFAGTHGNDWDCVMTIPENGWGYAKKWMGHWKTAYELEEILANCNSLDGNLVINFGPKNDGTFRPEEIDEAKQIGDWMKLNHEAIYNVHYAGWQKQDWGYYTESKDDKKVYMIVFNVPVSHGLEILPAKGIKVENATLLSGNKKLSIENLDDGASQVVLPNENFNQPFVIVLNITKGKTQREEKNNHI